MVCRCACGFDIVVNFIFFTFLFFFTFELSHFYAPNLKTEGNRWEEKGAHTVKRKETLTLFNFYKQDL